MAVDAQSAVAVQPDPARTAVRLESPRPSQDAGPAPAWTTSRLDQGPGWTLDVVRPRRVGDVAGSDVVAVGVGRDAFGEAGTGAAETVGGKAASGATPEPVA